MHKNEFLQLLIRRIHKTWFFNEAEVATYFSHGEQLYALLRRHLFESRHGLKMASPTSVGGSWKIHATGREGAVDNKTLEGR